MKLFTSTENEKWVEGEIRSEKFDSCDLKIETEKRQTMMGFGGCFNELGQLGLDTLTEDERAGIFDCFFGPDSELRFDFCRLPVGASDYAAEWYSHNETDGDFAMEHFSIDRDKKILIPYIKEALRRNPELTLFASPWSPPAWLKHPKAYNHGTLVWKPEYLKAYALYFVKFIQAYAAEGIPIHQLHVQNEMFSDQKFPSCVWTAEQLAEFIEVYLDPAFQKHKINTEIWLGTMNGGSDAQTDFDTFAFKILNSPASRCIKGVAYQWGGKDSVRRQAECFPQIPIIQSENECGDGQNSWAYAKYIYRLSRRYITNGVCAYVYWNMILNSRNGCSTWGWRQNCMVSIENGQAQYNHEYYIFKHLCRFVGKGAVRRKLSGLFSGMSVAFETPAGQKVILVHNPLDRAFELCVDADGQTAKAVLPPDSVSTIVFDEPGRTSL